jgi:pyruvate dehydrogenase phosphatase
VGACGITAIVHDDRVYIGNAGDSMGMFILAEGETYRSQKTNERLSVNSRA